MDPTLAARFPFEVLDGVGQEDVAAHQAGFLERFVEHGTGGTNERMSLPILLIAGLFADEHDSRTPSSFAKDRLGGVAIKITAATTLRSLVQNLQARCLRDEGRGIARLMFFNASRTLSGLSRWRFAST